MSNSVSYSLVSRPRPKCWQRKYAWLYPLLDRLPEDQAIAVPLNGEPVRRMRDTIRKSLWRMYGMRILSTAKDGKLYVWPVEVELESGPKDIAGKHRHTNNSRCGWEIIHAKAPVRIRVPAPAS